MMIWLCIFLSWGTSVKIKCNITFTWKQCVGGVFWAFMLDFVFSSAVINPLCSLLTPPPPCPGVLPQVGAARLLHSSGSGGGSGGQTSRVHHLQVPQQSGARLGLRHVQATHEMRKQHRPSTSWSVSPRENTPVYTMSLFPRPTAWPRRGRCAAGAPGPASDRPPSSCPTNRSPSQPSPCRQSCGSGPSTTTYSWTSSSICTHGTEGF